MSVSKYITILTLLLGTLDAVSQKVPDCIDPYEIKVPNVCGEPAEQFYFTEDDRFTYWYKIRMEQAAKFTMQLSPIDSTDVFDMLLYKHDGKGSFCNDLVGGKVKPISVRDQEIEGQKGDVFYVGVFHLNGWGCGHSLVVNSAGACEYLAIHQNCIELVAAKKVVQEEAFQKIEVKAPDLKVTDEVVHGKVVNAKTRKQINGRVWFTEKKSGDRYPVLSTAENGFTFEADLFKKYDVKCELFGYKVFEDEAYWSEFKPYEVKMVPLEVGDKVVMRSIYFHPNTYALKEGADKDLNFLAEFLKDNEFVRIEIQGHTNGNRFIRKNKKYANRGEEWKFSGTAKKLSKYRAESLKKYLVTKGIKSDRIEAAGYGGDRMIVPNARTMEQAMKNIRVEVHVIE